MWERLNRCPSVVYHFTRKENVENIKKDRQLKKFRDTYVFVCEKYEDCITVIKNTILNPKARYVDFDGIPKSYSNKNIEDYIILRLEVRHCDTLSWFKSQSSKNSTIDNLTLAYKGNLPVSIIEEMDIIL